MSLTITIPGAVDVTTGSMAPAVLTIGVGVPGAQGPQGATGPGVPAGGTAGQYLQKIDGTNYNTDWVTLNLSSYLTTAAAASTYQTLAGMSSYLTTSAAASTYYPLSGNPSGFLTSSALTGYATQSWVSAGFAPLARAVPSSGTTGQVLTKNSGTDYDASWATFIPGDRYLTTSSTSNTIGNGTKTFTVGTGLSYTTQQDIVIAYDASNHMHALVTSYNSGTGVLVADVQHHSGSGTYTSWTVNVGGTTPLQTVEWGEILGTLGDQTDLSTALNSKLESSTAATTYAALAGATFTGEVVTPASTTSNAGLTITPGVAPTTPTNGEIWATTNDLQVRLNGVTETIAEQSWVTAQGYLTSAPVTSVAGKTGAVSLVVGDVSGAAALAGATFTGLVTTVAPTTTTAGLNLPHGVAPTTPVNGDIWTTTSGLFARINAGTKQLMNLGDTQTVSGNITFSNASSTYGSSTAAGTINVASGATISASTKTVNVATGGVVGSTTLTTIGPVLGASTTSIGGTTAASTLNLATGATLTATTKAVNIGTAGVAGSTTNIVIGSTTGTSTTTLQGITNGVTPAVDTNSVALATTAYVVGQAGSATPLVDGTATVGTSLRYARQDHVHPTDTSRAPLNSPTFTGTPSLPTGTTAVTQTAGNNTTAVATTAFVTAATPAASTTVAGLLELATRLEVVEPSSSTLAVSPMRALDVLMNPGYVQIAQNNGNVSTATVGTGASVFTTSMTRVCIGPNTSVAGSVYYRPQTNGGVAQFYAKGSNLAAINFSKPFWMSGRSSYDDTFRGDANNTSRITVGKAGTTIGALAQKGIGWQKVGGLGSNFFLLAHNGTTLTSVDTSTSLTSLGITGGVPFDWSVYSDGAGNVTMFINDVQVATTSAGPTGNSTGSSVWQEEIDQSASAATRMYFTTFGGHYYHA